MAGPPDASVPHVLVVVCDSWGVGDAPDAATYGDEGSDTLSNTAEAVGGIRAPNLEALGLGMLTAIKGIEPAPAPGAGYGRATERSAGKDTTTGHWEMMGIRLDEPFPLYPDGFPPEIIGAFEGEIGRAVLGNKPASGTEIIAELGEEHLKTRRPIVYTSGDSVFQIATHKSIVELPTLYEWSPDRAAPPDRSASRRPRDRPPVRRGAGSLRPEPRAAGLLHPTAGTDRARPAPGSGRRGPWRRQDPGHLLRPGDHGGAVLGLERPRSGSDRRVSAESRACFRVHESRRLRLEVWPPERPSRLCGAASRPSTVASRS